MITLIDKTWKFSKGSLVIEKGEKVGTLYLCNGISNFVNALTSKGKMQQYGIISLDT